MVLVPLWISGGANAFRLPKLLLYEAAAIAAGAILVAAHIFGRPVVRRSIREPELYLPMLVVAWTAIATVASTNRRLSLDALLWVVCCAVMFVVTDSAGRDRKSSFLTVLMIPSLLNAAVYTTQELKIWSPFEMEPEHGSLRSVGLMGTSSDLGVYLLGPALAMLAMVFASTRWRTYGALALISGAALFATATITAIAAYFVGAVTLVARRYRRRSLVPLSVAAAVVAAGVLVYAPLRGRAAQVTEAVLAGSFDSVISGRATPFYAAVDMFRDHPLTGVGPGCYGLHYYPYKLRVEERHPEQLDSPLRNINAGEAHNDHLQTLAVSGLPGYILLVTCMISLARVSALRHDPDSTVLLDERERFARWFALPFVLAFVVVAAGQFPLEIGGVMSGYIHLAAIVTAWGRR